MAREWAERRQWGDYYEEEEYEEEGPVELYEEDLELIEKVKVLGKGNYGEVYEAIYNDKKVVLKLAISRKIRFKEEAKILEHLDGAGGAPKLFAFCHKPSAMIMSNTGISYDVFLKQCSSKWEVLDSLIKIGRNLQEIHDKGVIHNDLKLDNVTVSSTPDGGHKFHTIDFGISRYTGQVLAVIDCGKTNWMAPEVLICQPVSPKSDVYSFAKFIKDALKDVDAGTLWDQLNPLYVEATNFDPTSRCTLRNLIEGLQAIADTRE